MSVDPEKISKLIQHWIEHNRGHRESYTEGKQTGKSLYGAHEHCLHHYPVHQQVGSQLEDMAHETREAVHTHVQGEGDFRPYGEKDHADHVIAHGWVQPISTAVKRDER